MPNGSELDGVTDSPSATEAVGAGSVRVEPSAIPNLISSLQSSLDAVGVQIEHAITELRIHPWAGDPVSTGVAAKFNEHSVGGDRAALTALYGYRDRLQSASDALRAVERRYSETEDANTSRMRTGC
ncbi:hypothetical protein J2S53_004052 [Actinopolyspora lacussalsi]|uniref:PE family protein n=1 Tax=Actinopolyspora righensis TaxID=995060 RepID=A0A1I6YDA3_9ACTN|nr:PE domain-containing protein [Actinopolyspora righensis]MDP9644107.1 hypothetical protein [Actinopolyspora lacussalsi]SFT48473.1 PE family protein [Actinopolyspora righensis]